MEWNGKNPEKAGKEKSTYLQLGGILFLFFPRKKEKRKKLGPFFLKIQVVWRKVLQDGLVIGMDFGLHGERTMHGF